MIKKKNIIVFLFLLSGMSLLLSACNSTGKKVEELEFAAPHLSENAQFLLNYIHDISGKYTLTGQHSYLSRLSLAQDSIFQLTGKYPAIWGGDFGFSGVPGDTDDIAYRDQLIQEIKLQHSEGSIITITYHQANPVMGEPCTFEEGIKGELSDQEWDALLDEGSVLHGNWQAQMDLIAGYLKQLKVAGISVLFRPYHEMNGDWFWWGGHPGNDRYIALWKQLYELYTVDHKLDNLIWVWSPDDPDHGLEGYYPGDDYVDIVGCDIYHFGKQEPYYVEDKYKRISAISPGKPLSIGECSQIPSEAVLEEQPLWTWFMSWDVLVFQLNSSERLIELYNSERYITRDELPDFSLGKKSKAIRAGFSEIGITPEKPIILSGYGGRDDPFEAVHDSIYAQAMYLTQGDEEVLVITSELIGHSHVLVKHLKEKIEKECGIPGEKVFVTAAHNHGGPVNGTYAPLDKLPQDVKDYIEVLYDKLLQISVEARNNVQDVRIGFDRGECKMNINRRAEFSEGEIWLGRDADKPCDHDLDIIKFTDSDGKLKAVHVNFPCHGTCTGQENFQVSGDWPGISARMMQEQLGDDVIIMVTAGASADVAPIYGPHKYFREVNAVAYGISSVALKLVEKCNTLELMELKSGAVTKTFPGKKGWSDNFPQESAAADEEVLINFSAFRMGNIVMAGISGELFTEIGMNVKKRSTTSTTIMTHCNGASGYILTDVAYEEGGYEPQVSPFMPGYEADYENTLVELIESLQ